MATHFSGDFYFCRNQIAFEKGCLLETLMKLECFKKIIGMKWRILQSSVKSSYFCGSNSELLILVYAIASEQFLLIDIIAAENQVDLQELGEELIAFFRPQVIAIDNRLRGVHLLH